MTAMNEGHPVSQGAVVHENGYGNGVPVEGGAFNEVRAEDIKATIREEGILYKMRRVFHVAR